MILKVVNDWTVRSNKLERLWLLAKIEFKLRYYENRLGLLWALIKPLFDVLIYYVVFKLILNNNVPAFASFLFIGLIFWIFFVESTTGTIQILHAKKYLYEYSNMNKLEIYVSTLMSNSIGFFFNFMMFILFYYIIQRRKFLEGLILLTGLIIGVFVIFKFMPQTLNRFKELTYTDFNYKNMGAESHYNMEVTDDQWNGANFRLAAWACGWELFQENPITGVGIGDKFDALMKKYEEKDFQFAIQTKKNVHNNYLDILYSMGLIGLIVFLTAWIILPIIYAKNHQEYLTFLIIITFATAWITEIYFDRSFGGMLTGFFISFLLTNKNN